LGSQESAAALKRIIRELGGWEKPPLMMIRAFANIAQGFEDIAATAYKERQNGEHLSRSGYNSYEALLHEAENVCRRASV
jgi:hypothetical protein